MKQSKFQFKNPNLLSFNYKLNINDEKGGLEEKFSVKIINREKTTALVVLNAIIGGNEDEAPYTIEATIATQIAWPEETAKNAVDALLNKSTPALLLSYLRPIVNNVTAHSPFPALNIPFFDFTDN